MCAMGSWQWLVLSLAVLFLIVFLATLGKYFALYIQAFHAGAGVRFGDLIGMALRKVDPRVIVLSRIRAVRAGLDISVEQLETHYLAGGRVAQVVTAMTVAAGAGMQADWRVMTTLDLAGRNTLSAVEHAIKMKNPELLTNWELLTAGADEFPG